MIPATQPLPLPRAPASLRDRALLLGAAALLATSAAVGTGLAWRGGWELNHVAGAWVGLALDLVHGTFYRPLVGPEGYGGTRFMPLYFVLHAGLIELFGHPIATGYALGLLAGGALLGGFYALLRAFGLAPLEAAACAALPLAGESTQAGLVSIRGDVLPVALALWGLAALARRPLRRWAVPAAALCFTLAIATKMTALPGIAAGAAWLAARRERRPMVRLLGWTGLGLALVIGLAEVASSGRFVSILSVCASGGASWKGALAAPFKMGVDLVRFDPGGLVLAALAALFLVTQRRSTPLLPALLWRLSFLVAILIFASPGTGPNHLVDLEVASALVLALGLTRQEGLGTGLGRGALVLLAASALLAGAAHLRRAEVERSKQSRIASALAVAGTPDRPILSEDPLVPVAAGQRPYLLDPFMLRIARRSDPALVRPLFEGLRARAFGAVVLLRPLQPDRLGWYEKEHFGPGFSEAVRASYVLSGRAGGYYVYLPRTEEVSR